MRETTDSDPETRRLEALWSGEFGDAYVERNRGAGLNRGRFWQSILSEFPSRRILEVGCNLGCNLRWIAEMVPPTDVFGIDVNEKALKELHTTLPSINVVRSLARRLPFRNCGFDLVITMGLLMHQPENTLSLVMAEIVRCSWRYVFCGEYYAEDPTEVPYRGQRNALIKRDFGRIYQELFPGLQLRKQGFLSREQGWDNVTYWVFEKYWEPESEGSLLSSSSDGTLQDP